MPTCMCASTQPGKARWFLPSKTWSACPTSSSGARRLILPPLMPMSRQSTEVLLGRTMRAFLMTRSNNFDIWLSHQPCCQQAALGVITFPDGEQFRRADQIVEAREVEHPITKRLGGAVRGQGGVIFARHMGERAHD